MTVLLYSKGKTQAMRLSRISLSTFKLFLVLPPRWKFPCSKTDKLSKKCNPIKFVKILMWKVFIYGRLQQKLSKTWLMKGYFWLEEQTYSRQSSTKLLHWVIWMGRLTNLTNKKGNKFYQSIALKFWKF